MSKTKMIGARVEIAMHEKLQAAADKERRRLSDFIRIVLEDALSKRTESKAA